MSLRGMKIKVEDKKGSFTFTNEIANKITLEGFGKVDLKLEDLQVIFEMFKTHFEKPAVIDVETEEVKEN